MRGVDVHNSDSLHGKAFIFRNHISANISPRITVPEFTGGVVRGVHALHSKFLIPKTGTLSQRASKRRPGRPCRVQIAAYVLMKSSEYTQQFIPVDVYSHFFDEFSVGTFNFCQRSRGLYNPYFLKSKSLDGKPEFSRTSGWLTVPASQLKYHDNIDVQTQSVRANVCAHTIGCELTADAPK